MELDVSGWDVGFVTYTWSETSVEKAQRADPRRFRQSDGHCEAVDDAIRSLVDDHHSMSRDPRRMRQLELHCESPPVFSDVELICVAAVLVALCAEPK